MTESVNARNIQALHEAIKSDRQKLSIAESRVEALSKQVAMFQGEIQQLRGQIAMLMGRLGGGATAR